ncbi:GntR family transcriptional regulator [Rhodobacteraceae bacterium N5(2021)]|uniref:GntR family transcriptional regulator n=1 Tax=Gymnodinialimonas phycosphaerae TaxID=2841589 RepID=A0A975TSR1_9RHOB|nr:GntR family transcriptional regulator [Gymnodinialimonas phycosphaerae]MBY4893486.1 GntR family transcriptional regulator [Gymnodinialimonas phycosphaerae]
MARKPLYQIVEADMVSRIATGAWEVGRRLPNEFGLADEFNVSQGTMRRALITLEQKGFLSRKPGRGTIVAAQAPVTEASATALPRLLDATGSPLVMEPFRGRSGTRAATPAEADLLGTARVAYLERTLKHAGARAALEELVVSEATLPTLSEDAAPDLTQHLAEANLAADRIEATAHAEVTDMAQSVALSTDRHTALLCVRSVAFDASGTAIAVQRLKLAVPGAQLVHISG